MGAAAPYLRSDADEMSSSCGNTALIGVDLSLYGHRQLVYHRRTATEEGLPWEPIRAPWRRQTARAVLPAVFPAISPDLKMPEAQSDKSNRVKHLAHLLPYTAGRLKSTHWKPGRT